MAKKKKEEAVPEPHPLTIDELIAALQRAREKVGGEAGVVCVEPWGEMTFGFAGCVITGDFYDRHGYVGNIEGLDDEPEAKTNNVHCAIVSNFYGEELSRKDTYHWLYRKDYEKDKV